MVKSILISICLVLAAQAGADALPGFKLEKVATSNGFITSMTFDSKGTLHYSTQPGSIFRVEGGASVELREFPLKGGGNAGVLGFSFNSDDLITVHYVARDLTADVIARYDLREKKLTEIASFLCAEGRICSDEHHGGNTALASDGSVYVGFGDFGIGTPAQDVNSPAGKLIRVLPDGTPLQFARGFRNPFDLAWHPGLKKLVVSDNGPAGGDEVSIIGEGDNGGWPMTSGNGPVVPNTVRPAYSFDETVAPTGITVLRKTAYFPEGGVLLGGFVTHALYFFPDITKPAVPRPVVLFKKLVGPIIDVAQHPVTGDIYVAAPKAIFRLLMPQPGDANGDSLINDADFDAIAHELLDGDGTDLYRTHEGTVITGWGADANLDGSVDARDLVTLGRTKGGRRHPVR